MKVKIIKEGVTLGYSVLEVGDTVDLSDRDAANLIADEYAEAVASGKPKAKAAADNKKADN